MNSPFVCDSPRRVEDVRIPGFEPLRPGEKICPGCEAVFSGPGYGGQQFCTRRCRVNASCRESRERKKEKGAIR